MTSFTRWLCVGCHERGITTTIDLPEGQHVAMLVCPHGSQYLRKYIHTAEVRLVPYPYFPPNPGIKTWS